MEVYWGQGTKGASSLQELLLLPVTRGEQLSPWHPPKGQAKWPEGQTLQEKQNRVQDSMAWLLTSRQKDKGLRLCPRAH